MSDPVRKPTLRQCCSAAVGSLHGAVRPRPVDERYLRSITDAGLPSTQRTVTVTALPQVPRSAPTPAVVEGVFTPSRIASSLTSFVVQHPEATFIVDPSYCLDAEHRAIAQLQGVIRPFVRPPAETIPTITALRSQPALPALDFALPTHAHWDHVCGLLDFPELPVHLHSIERSWAMTGPVAPVGGVRDALVDRPVVDYELDGPPVLTFTRSHDLFGDGSLVLVDLAGHTPGSVGLLAHTARGWILLAGDAAWHAMQIERVRQKPSFPGLFVDENRDLTFKTLHRLHLAMRLIPVIPTHDHDAARRLAAPDAEAVEPLP
ncbi:MBL fold metallo-hydrolase [Nocardia aurantiaca]|uniref:MBL fold metallo-hydrolase n=1 Tax=Nocardia aurantiaca TaxID=2675850 RepID=A0A6I3L444_9NOCA|nr:MBL fold metallo-hydrolase [Nocardia aurantiaca]MTE16311.1 MBL fold metallo-hydrolase [Nocardia aurantiaca]